MTIPVVPPQLLPALRHRLAVTAALSKYKWAVELDQVWAIDERFELTEVSIDWQSLIYSIDWEHCTPSEVARFEGVDRRRQSLIAKAVQWYHDFLALKRAAVVKRSTALLITLAFVEWLVFQSRAGEPERMSKLRLAYAGI